MHKINISESDWKDSLGPIDVPDCSPVTVEDPEGVVLERPELFEVFEMLVKIRLMLLSIAGLPQITGHQIHSKTARTCPWQLRRSRPAAVQWPIRVVHAPDVDHQPSPAHTRVPDNGSKLSHKDWNVTGAPAA